MQTMLAIQKGYGRRDGPTDRRMDGPTLQGAESRIRD